MSVIITSNYAVLAETVSYPLTHARILYRKISRLSAATITASSETTGFPASAADNELTYEHWKPSALPATYEVNAGAAVNVNAVGIASHTLGSDSATVEWQYYDGSTWQTRQSTAPGDDAPILILDDDQSAQRHRIRITGTTVPSVGVVFMGESLNMQRPIYGGHSPIRLSRVTSREPNRSERGQWLGLSLIRQGVTADYSWQNLTASWYRANFDPFVEYATQSAGTFFIAWRPQKYPNEVGYCWVDQDDITPSNMGVRDLMSVDMTVIGQIDFETPDITRFS